MSDEPRPHTPLCAAFQIRAAATSDLLRRGAAVGLVPGEETLTDLNLLELAAASPGAIRTLRFNRFQETAEGADWEWWLGGPKSWLGLRLQAKKYDPSTGAYDSLRRRGVAISQAESLIERAVNPFDGVQRYPLYCFYNHWEGRDDVAPFAWQCRTFPESRALFGCSVAPAPLVLDGLRGGGIRLEDLGAVSLPWSCLVCCTGFGPPDDRVAAAAALLDHYLFQARADADLARYRAGTHPRPPDYVLGLLEGADATDLAPALADHGLSHVLVTDTRAPL